MFASTGNRLDLYITSDMAATKCNEPTGIDCIKYQNQSKKYNIVLFGYPGSGKTTIAKKLQTDFNQFHIISSGKILRKD